jgi:hypothetical protein
MFTSLVIDFFVKLILSSCFHRANEVFTFFDGGLRHHPIILPSRLSQRTPPLAAFPSERMRSLKNPEKEL